MEAEEREQDTPIRLSEQRDSFRALLKKCRLIKSVDAFDSVFVSFYLL